MRKSLSIFMLFVRSSLYRVLAVIALMLVAECGVFFVTMKKFLDGMAAGERGYFVLNRLIEESKIGVLFCVAFILVTVLLCRVGSDRKGGLEYTIQRLGISPVRIFFLQAACNALFYALLWLVQVYTAFAFSTCYLHMADAALKTNQTLFLEAYRSGFLFGIFPMENVWGWIADVVLVLSLGIVTARVPHASRRRKLSFGFFAMMLVMAFAFWQGFGAIDSMIILLGWPLLIVGMTIVFVFMTEPGLDADGE